MIRVCSTVICVCSTVICVCSTVIRVCSTVIRVCSTVIRVCSTVIRVCSTVIRVCSTVIFVCSTVIHVWIATQDVVLPCPDTPYTTDILFCVTLHLNHFVTPPTSRLLAYGPMRLLLAAMTGDHAGIERLVQGEGISAGHAFLHGRTALHEACHCAHVEAVRALIRLGADVNAQAGAQCMAACKRSQPKSVCCVCQVCQCVVPCTHEGVWVYTMYM